jgi:single-stranded-DNA-specific exonuclease
MNWIEKPAASSALIPGLHPLVSLMLSRRGIQSSEMARAFLDPQAYTPTPSVEIPGIEAAAEALEMAIRKRLPICVWGDFDVDGQTSTAILFQTLEELGADVKYHIPIRASEGHGVNLPRLQEIIEHGAKLILTCDTGITAHAAVNYARSRQVEMLITDHHEIPEVLPTALAVADPRLLPTGHPLSTLSGSGVAFKLAEALYERFGCPAAASRHLDLAALGLVADLAPLSGDARYLVQLGLRALGTTHRLGLQTMMEMTELDPSNLSEEHISFVLAPRLNALGRLGDANPAVEFLTTTDIIKARVLATQLEGLNTQRQLLCSQVTHAAEAQLHADASLLEGPVIVLGHPTWPGGVVGIVGSRLVERYRKPVILFSTPIGQPAQGSARSVEGVNITSAIAAQKDLLINFGGHPMAAGLSLETEKLPEFTRRLWKTVAEMLVGVDTNHNLAIDNWLSLPELSEDLVAAIETLAPFGPANEKPILATHSVKIESVTKIGRSQEHLKMRIADETGHQQTVLWWNGADESDRLPESPFDLAFTLRGSDWQGNKQIQMEFVDLQIRENAIVVEKRRKVKVTDLRNSIDLSHVLTSLQSLPAAVLWAEGKEKRASNGKDRTELTPGDNLIIWTIPPSPEEFHSAMERVNPERVYLVAVTDPSEPLDSFIGRLFGLLKYAINHHSGRVSYARLETGTAQRAITVRKGLQWLTAQGRIVVNTESPGELIVSSCNSTVDPSEISRLTFELNTLLAETCAYRMYFKEVDKDILFQSE